MGDSKEGMLRIFLNPLELEDEETKSLVFGQSYSITLITLQSPPGFPSRCSSFRTRIFKSFASNFDFCLGQISISSWISGAVTEFVARPILRLRRLVAVLFTPKAQVLLEGPQTSFCQA